MLTVNSPVSSFKRLVNNLTTKKNYHTKRNRNTTVLHLSNALQIAEYVLKNGPTEEKLKELRAACGNPEVLECFGFVNICQE